MATHTTTQQVINFIQCRIAEAHAEGEDIVTLLSNSEVAFCLQVLEGNHVNAQQSPTKAQSAKNMGQKEAELAFPHFGAKSLINSNFTSTSYL